MSIKPASQYEAPVPSAAQAGQSNDDDDSEDDDDDDDDDSDPDLEESHQWTRQSSGVGESSDMDMITGTSFTRAPLQFFGDETERSEGAFETDRTMTMEFTKPLGGALSSSGRRSLAASEGDSVSMDMVDDEDSQVTIDASSVVTPSQPHMAEDRTQSMQLTGISLGLPVEEEEATAEESYRTASSADSEEIAGGDGAGASGRVSLGGQSAGEASMDFTVPLGAGLSRISEEDSDMLDSTRQTISMEITKAFGFTPAAPAAAAAAEDRTATFTEPAAAAAGPRHSEPLLVGTPSRVRNQLLHGHASPAYRHSPARRVTLNASGQEMRGDGPDRPARMSPRKEMALPTELPAVAASALPPHMLALQGQGSTSMENSIVSSDGSYSTAGALQVEATLQTFLDAVGLKFQDQLSTVRPRVARPDDVDEQNLGSNVVRWSKAAAAGAVLLENLSQSCHALETHIAQSREDLFIAEKEFDENPPSYAVDVLSYPPRRRRSARRWRRSSSCRSRRRAPTRSGSTTAGGWTTSSTTRSSCASRTTRRASSRTR